MASQAGHFVPGMCLLGLVTLVSLKILLNEIIIGIRTEFSVISEITLSILLSFNPTLLCQLVFSVLII